MPNNLLLLVLLLPLHFPGWPWLRWGDSGQVVNAAVVIVVVKLVLWVLLLSSHHRRRRCCP